MSEILGNINIWLKSIVYKRNQYNVYFTGIEKIMNTNNMETRIINNQS